MVPLDAIRPPTLRRDSGDQRRFRQGVDIPVMAGLSIDMPFLKI
jgi:hypothetical protein